MLYVARMVTGNSECDVGARVVSYLSFNSMINMALNAVKGLVIFIT